MCFPKRVAPGMSPCLAHRLASLWTAGELAAGHVRLSASLPSTNEFQLPLEVESRAEM